MAASIPSLRDILLRLRYLVAHSPPELREAMAQRVRILAERVIAQFEGEPQEQPQAEQPTAPAAPPPAQPPPASPQPIVPDIARQLWALSRGNPDIFTAYARSYPNPELNQIADNPAQLNALMNQINDTQSVPPVGQADGVNQAPLQSSNVYGFRYDPLKKRLTVRFNQGSVYRYEGVPRQIFEMFSSGDGVARTSGSNRWGRWWRGKSPSLGAALHELIKMGGFPYQRVR